MTTPILVRRSNLLVPFADTARVNDAWRHNADAITLDLVGNSAAREQVRSTLMMAAKGGAEVFVRIDSGSMEADLTASVWPGVCGVVLPRAESAAQVKQAADTIARLERERGMTSGSVEIMPCIETARGIWHIRAIVRASPRIRQAALDEAALVADLGFTPQPELDPFDYARGRMVVECTAAQVGAIGMSYPLSVLPRELPHGEIHKAATKAKNLGMKGVLCPYAGWVAPVNEAFTPTPELVQWNRRVREAFAAGVAAGTAAVPLDGKMIDVPVDEWAIVVLATAEACAARDAEKQAALGRA